MVTSTTPEKTWLGIFNLFLGGLLFCLLLKRSGDLWLPIGFHASWDWAQTYLYGIPDSGRTLPGHLLGGSFSGPFWLSGGTAGSEGSTILTLFLILFWVGIASVHSDRISLPMVTEFKRVRENSVMCTVQGCSEVAVYFFLAGIASGENSRSIPAAYCERRAADAAKRLGQPLPVLERKPPETVSRHRKSMVG